LRGELGSARALFLHLTLVPYISTAGETKTKPTQHSVKELRSIGIQPDVLVCRSEQEIDESSRHKIALFTNVDIPAVISLPDTDSIYRIPSILGAAGLDEIIVNKLHLDCPKADYSEWDRVVDSQLNPEREVKLAMVGKYMELLDAYKSLNEAIIHAGIQTRTKVNFSYIDSSDLMEQGVELLHGHDAILIPGGFGERGFEGKIHATKFARENNIPFLGICLGLQAAVVDYARHVANLKDANSTEFEKDCENPVIALISEWTTAAGTTEVRDENSDLGGTMRLGGQKCVLDPDSATFQCYQQEEIIERHRHRYEFNNDYLDILSAAGLKLVGKSADGMLVEVIEIPDHPWFIGCQFHPEFTSTPREGHPLFTGFIKAAIARHEQHTNASTAADSSDNLATAAANAARA
ncbi:MAG TPA: CTP synthetase, partial [Gammaproteobacteria bacterium]|nr:CTP synthetase [Gammaproteobacteria bacterium]